MKRLWLAVMAVCALSACIDFDGGREAFCAKRPDACGTEATFDGGKPVDAGTDSGIPDGGPDDAGPGDAGEDGGIDSGTPVDGWSAQLGGEQCTPVFELTALDQNVEGQVVVAGIAQGSCELGGGTTAPLAMPTAFFSRFAADGGHQLLRKVTGQFVPGDVALASNGAVVLVGSTHSFAELSDDAGCETEPNDSGTAACVVSYAANGDVQWVQRFTSALDAGGAYVAPRVLVSAADDSVRWAGAAYGEIAPPGGCGATATVPDAGWLFGSFASDGGSCWFGVSTCQGGVDDLAVDPQSGDLFALGRASTTATSCDVVTPGTSAKTVTLTGGSYVAARMTATGSITWATELPELSATSGRARLAWSDGQLFVAAPFSGALTGAFNGVSSAGGSVDLLLFQLDTADGGVRADAGYRQLGGSGEEALNGFAASSDGGLWIAAHSGSTDGISFGGDLFAVDGGADLFVGQFDLTLGHRYSRSVRGDGASTVNALKARGASPALTGALHGTIDLGDGPRQQSAAGLSGYVGTLTLP